jgi:hypothetical protein
MRIWRQQTVVALVLGAMTLASLGAASADASDTCAFRFPEASWSIVAVGPISIEESGLAPEMAVRFADEIGIAEEWLVDEIGPFEVTVCLVGTDSLFDADPYREGSQRFHIASDLEEQFVVMNTDRSVGFVAPAMAFALTQHALYQNNGDAAFPEPLASTIGHWYRARMLDRLPYYHNDEMTSNLFDTESRIDWTAGEQEIFRTWNPERNFRSIGDLVDFAARTRGMDILLVTDGAVWAEIEGDWRTALRVELTGRSTPTTGWKMGIAIVVTILVTGTAVATISIVQQRRAKKRPPTDAPIPGFFVDPSTEPDAGSGGESS